MGSTGRQTPSPRKKDEMQGLGGVRGRGGQKLVPGKECGIYPRRKKMKATWRGGGLALSDVYIPGGPCT